MKQPKKIFPILTINDELKKTNMRYINVANVMIAFKTLQICLYSGNLGEAQSQLADMAKELEGDK